MLNSRSSWLLACSVSSVVAMCFTSLKHPTTFSL
jgi:hypothetical protein